MPPVPPPPEEIDVDVELDGEWTRVRAWRQQQLEVAGVAPFAAFRLALIPDLDLHRACDMARQGCPDWILVDLLID